MGSFSTFHWLIVLGVVVLVFGAGRLPQALGDLAKGVKTFKKEMQEPDPAAAPAPRSTDEPAR